MNVQWTWVLGILFSIVIAVFSIANIESVPVNYIFGTAQWPLVLVILSSALLGAAISGFLAMFRAVMAKKHKNELVKEIAAKDATIEAQQHELAALHEQLTQQEAEVGKEEEK